MRLRGVYFWVVESQEGQIVGSSLFGRYRLYVVNDCIRQRLCATETFSYSVTFFPSSFFSLLPNSIQRQNGASRLVVEQAQYLCHTYLLTNGWSVKEPSHCQCGSGTLEWRDGLARTNDDPTTTTTTTSVHAASFCRSCHQRDIGRCFSTRYKGCRIIAFGQDCFVQAKSCHPVVPCPILCA